MNPHLPTYLLWFCCTDLADVSAAPNNGTEGSLYHLLRDPPTLPPRSNGGSYSTGQYPSTDAQYDSLVNAADAACDCSQVIQTVIIFITVLF